MGSIWSFLPTLSQSHGQSSEILLGCMLALYGLYGLCVKKLPHLGKHERWLSPIIGYIGGAVTVATGVIIIPIVPYLQSLHLKRDELVQALGLTFTVSTICLAVFYTITRCQGYHWTIVYLSLRCWLRSLECGSVKIRYRLNEQIFRRIFL